MSSPQPVASEVKPAPSSSFKKLMKSTTIVSCMTMLSRVTGFMRDLVVAYAFGATGEADAFLVAFRIPNFMRRLFAEGAFSQAFVPVLAEYRETRNEDDVKTFLNRMAGIMSFCLFLIVLLAIIATPVLAKLFVPGFHAGSQRYDLTITMLRVTFPYLMFISLTAYLGAILNSYGRFAIPAFTPVLLNLVMVVAALCLPNLFSIPIMALAWGVFIAGIVQLLFQLPFLKQIDKLPKPSLNWSDPGVNKVLKLMVPALFGVSVGQINILIDTVFASFLPNGSIAWLYYSDRLSSFPLGVFGVAIATVILPHLSRKHAAKSPQAYSETLDWSIRCILIIGFPATLGLFMLAGPLMATLFKHGEFTQHDVLMSAKSLMAFALGVQAFMLIKVLASGFYAQQDIKTPVRVGIIAMICNTLLNCILIFPLAHAGLALSTTLAAYLNTAFLAYYLLKRKIYTPSVGWLSFSLRLLSANAAMALVIYFSCAEMTRWFAWSWEMRAVHLLIIVSLAVAVYFMMLWIVGLRIKHIRINSD